MSINVTVLREQCSLTVWSGDEGKCQVCDNVIVEGRRTVYCSKKCSLWWERNHVWRKARVNARRKGKYACSVCGETKATTKIEVDHRQPINGVNYNIPSCIHHEDNLQVLCKKHHNEKSSLEASLRAESRRQA